MRLNAELPSDRAHPSEEAAELAGARTPGDSRRSLIDGALIAAAFLVWLSPGSALAQLVVVEPGFTVTTLPPGVGAKGIECSPGGIWGDFVYVADSNGGTIDRIDFADNVTLFASGLSFPVGMDFGPGPGASFGDFLYVAEFSGSSISRVDSSGVVTPFAVMTSPADVKFDPTGVYGNDLHATTAFASPINTIDSAGLPSLFTAFSSLYLRFGPGGAWGSGLYATDTVNSGVAKIDSAGLATPFIVGLGDPEGFDWAFGPGFDGDMFLTDVSEGRIYRVESTGATTVFATLGNAADVAFCNGALYAVALSGGCYKVTEGSVGTLPSFSTAGILCLVLSLVVVTGLEARRTRRLGGVV